jgi:hypothetical protein
MGLQSLIEAAEASTKLPSVSTPLKTDQGHTPIDAEVNSFVLDVAQSPIKKKPPWKDGTLPTTKSDESALEVTQSWFADTLADSKSQSPTQKYMMAVEQQLREQFPKCLPMSCHLLEFLAQSASPLVLQPSLHPNLFMMNGFVTAVPDRGSCPCMYKNRII